MGKLYSGNPDDMHRRLVYNGGWHSFYVTALFAGVVALIKIKCKEWRA